MRSNPDQKLREWQQSLLTETVVGPLAVKAGFGERNRKLTPTRFLLAVVFGFGVEGERTLAGLQRFFSAISGVPVASSAFQTRFTSNAVTFFRLVYEHLLQLVAGGTGLPMRLSKFKDVLAIDGSVIALRDKLSRHFRACRTNATKSAAKLHGIMSLSNAALIELEVRSERFSERRFLAKHVAKYAGHLLVFDLGYFKHALFEQIHRLNAFFVSRLKDSSNPYLVEIRRGIRKTKAAIGTRLDDNDFEGDVVDASVRLGQSGKTVFRIVGLRFPGTDQYRFYLTNLGLEFTAEDIAAIYTRRWQIELLFKELKSLCRVDELPSTKPNTVLCLMYASLIAILLSRILKAATEKSKSTSKRIRRTVITKLLGQHAMSIAKALLSGPTTLEATLNEFIRLAEQLGADPNIRRRPTGLGVVRY